MTYDGIDTRPEVQTLFANLKLALPKLQAIADEADAEWGLEDGVYRFYHHSFKAYRLQHYTTQIVDALKALAPDRPLHPFLEAIVKEGAGRAFSESHNARWEELVCPIVHAALHTRYILGLALKYGRGLESPPTLLPSGWATFLYVFGLR